jgi:hypothetical protein
MAKVDSAVMRWHATWPRIATNLAAALLSVMLATPSTSRAETGSLPLITIPPAPVPPPPASRSVTSTPAAIAPAPESLLPTAVQILRDSAGSGIAMYGVLTGKAASATAVTLAIFANSGAFDPTPTPQLVVADEGDRHAQALFTATVRGVPAIGITVVALSDTGGDVTALYDLADNRFVKSFRRMQLTLKEDWGLQTVILSPLHLADGSEIGLPPGWRVTAQGASSVDLQGPRGEFISLGTAFPVYAGDTGSGDVLLEAPCCDPRQAFETLYPKIAAAAQRRGFPSQELTSIVESTTDPARYSGQGALILSNLRIDGVDYSYFAAVNAVAGLADPWTLTLSGAMAPRAIFAVEFPMLMQIWNSYGAVHPGFGLNLQLPEAISGMDATEAMLTAAVTRRETVDYNADPAWDDMIAAMTTAAPARYDDSMAQPLVDKISADTGLQWRIVPLSELR